MFSPNRKPFGERITHRSDYGAVASWLARPEKHGAQPHWIRVLLDCERVPAEDRWTAHGGQHEATPSMADYLLAPTEEMIKAIEAASPHGIADMKKGFADPDPSRILSVRLEMACAANLAWRKIPFDVGGKGQADLVWHPGTDSQGWVEIHRGAFDPFGSLTSDLERELTAERAIATVHMDRWPTDFKDKNTVFRTIVDAAKAASPARPFSVEVPQLGAGVKVLAERRLSPLLTGPSRVFVAHSALLIPDADYLQGVADRLVAKVEEKAAQVRRGDWEARTVVLVDISTAYLMRMLDRESLVAWLDSVAFDWAAVPFAAVAVSMTELTSPVVRGIHCYRPDLSAEERDRLEPVLSGLVFFPGSPAAAD